MPCGRICNNTGFATTHKRVLTSEGNTSSRAPLPTRFRNYRYTYCRNRHVAFLPAFMTTSGHIHGELLRLIFFVDSSKILQT